jgi:hypothetical protein
LVCFTFYRSSLDMFGYLLWCLHHMGFMMGPSKEKSKVKSKPMGLQSESRESTCYHVSQNVGAQLLLNFATGQGHSNCGGVCTLRRPEPPGWKWREVMAPDVWWKWSPVIRGFDSWD